MFSLNLPEYDAQLRKEGEKIHIYDDLRKKFVCLTPEEWVRQHFVHFLIERLGYPFALMANEKQIQVGNTIKRFDSLLYDRLLRPHVLMEYKAPSVELSDKVVSQAVRYNCVLHVPYLFISNGLEHLAYRIDYAGQSYTALDHIPPYIEINNI